MVFSLASIIVLGGILFSFVERTIGKKLFYKEAIRAYGFFDKKGNLRGLWDIEAFSMKNLASYMIQKKISNYKTMGMMFLAQNGDIHDKVVDKYSFEKMLTDSLESDFKLKHNCGLKAEVKILPLDDKIPFKKKFSGEIEEVLNLILDEEKVTNPQKLITVIIGAIKGATDVAEAKALEIVVQVVGADGFQNLEAWKEAFKKDKDMDRRERVLIKLRDSLTFSEQAEAVNLFLANKYVRKAFFSRFCEENKKQIQKIRSEIIKKYTTPSVTAASLEGLLAPNFTFGKGGSVDLPGILLSNTADAQKDFNLELIKLMFAKIATKGIKDELIDDYDKKQMYKVGKDEKIFAFINDLTKNAESFSKAIEIVVRVYDEEYQLIDRTMKFDYKIEPTP
jgi:hypothetical protein